MPTKYDRPERAYHGGYKHKADAENAQKIETAVATLVTQAREAGITADTPQRETAQWIENHPGVLPEYRSWLWLLMCMDL